jgi:hypothetical protein
MASRDQTTGGRPKPKTPAERAGEFAAAQRRLKDEAAERRAQAAERKDQDGKQGG